jgi:hypothetical protein
MLDCQRRKAGRLGHFAKYSPKQRVEVLRKGFLGPWAPDQGIKTARREADLRLCCPDTKLY